MPTLTVTLNSSTDAECRALEQGIAYLTHLQPVAGDAPAGTVLDACEQLVLGEDRAMLRTTLEAALQSRIRTADAAKKSLRLPVQRLPSPLGSDRRWPRSVDPRRSRTRPRRLLPGR